MPIEEADMLRAWALAEVTGPGMQIPQLDPVREKLRVGGTASLNDWDWWLLEKTVPIARAPILGALLPLRVSWYRGHLTIEALAEQARTFNFAPFDKVAPSRQLAALCRAIRRPDAPEFDRAAMTVPPVFVAPSITGPWCLIEGYRRCCRALRDRDGGRFDGQPLPVIVGVHPSTETWALW